MNLSIELLAAAFLQTHPEAEVRQPFSGFDISGIRLLPDNASTCVEEFLYVTDGAGLRRKWKVGSENISPSLHIICFLRAGDWLPLPGVMQIVSDLELAEALNALQNTFSEFADWKRELELSILRTPEPQVLLNLTDPVLHCPVLVYDPALKVLAWSRTLPEGFEDPIFNTAVREGYLDATSFRFLEGNNYISKVKQNAFLDLEADEYQQHALCAGTVSVDREIAAFCVMLYDSGVTRAYAKGIYLIFCSCLKELLELQSTASQRTRGTVDFFLMDLLDNASLSVEQIRDRLTLTGFFFDGSYVVLTLHSSIPQKSLEAYFINYLRLNLYRCQIFAYRQSIVILCPISAQAVNNYRQHLKTVFTPLLAEQQDKHPRLYVSRPFDRIELFPAAYAQAEHTAALSDEMDGSLFHYYEDWWISDLFAENGTREQLYCYCEPFLMELVKKSTPRAELELKILYEYLYHDRKLTYIAKKLNMHRNNVIYHIHQIEAKYHMDLDDPAFRLKLRISMELLRFHKLLPCDP